MALAAQRRWAIRAKDYYHRHSHFPLSTMEALLVPNSSDSSTPSSPVQCDVASASFQIALAAYTRWVEIDTVLSPIIGQHTVAGLYKRSVSLTRSAHPMLIGVLDASPTVGDYAPLQRLLAQQPVAIATAANEALLNAFNNLLSTLVGPSLTERLLRSALDSSASTGVAA